MLWTFVKQSLCYKTQRQTFVTLPSGSTLPSSTIIKPLFLTH